MAAATNMVVIFMTMALMVNKKMMTVMRTIREVAARLVMVANPWVMKLMTTVVNTVPATHRPKNYCTYSATFALLWLDVAFANACNQRRGYQSFITLAPMQQP